MTHQEAKSIARHLGLILRKVRSGDYRVNFRDGNETTAYYTDSLEDAVNTAVEMARNRELSATRRMLRRAGASKPNESVMTKSEKRCSHCGGKFGLVCHHHWGLRFCRKMCKDSFLAKTAREYSSLKRWLGFLSRGRA